MDLFPPEVGDLLLDEDNTLGMVTEVEFVYKKLFYLTVVEWYINGIAHEDIYHIGEPLSRGEYDISHISIERYCIMRENFLKRTAAYDK